MDNRMPTNAGPVTTVTAPSGQARVGLTGRHDLPEVCVSSSIADSALSPGPGNVEDGTEITTGTSGAGTTM